MDTHAREYPLEQYLLERLQFSGLQKENLIDLVGIIASLKNKYRIIPFAVTVQGEPVPNALTARYLMDSLLLNKLVNLLLDTPRLGSVLVVPHGFPTATQFELNVTVG